MNDGHVDGRVKRKVLNGLKGYVSRVAWMNGDLKERGALIIQT